MESSFKMSINVLPHTLSRQKNRSLSTYSFRQAPARPLQHYIEREAAILSVEVAEISADSTNSCVGIVSSTIENGFIANGVGEVTSQTALVPVTDLTSLVAFSGTQPINRQFVSVRRGWGSRLVNRLAARSLKNSETEFALEASTHGVSENLSVKGAPFLLNTSDSTERRPNNWISGTAQALRATSLTRLLSRLAGVPVHLVFVNALSLARFDFDRDIASRTPVAEVSRLRSASNRLRAPTSARFLSRLEQERGSRFSAASGRLPDLLRLGFVAIYLKNAGVLAQLLATSLARLPRNRKEIPFIRFRIKVVKVLVSARPERLGVRLSFKGRVARWNRTKVLRGESGILALYTYSSRLEGGRAQAITRKGTIGVRVWLAYHPSFAKRFRPTLLAFIRTNA